MDPSGDPVSTGKPRILLLIDKPGWAFDFVARALVERLSHRFTFSIRASADSALMLDPADYDLAYVFFWGDRTLRRFGFERERIIKEIASHRFETDPAYGGLDANAMIRQHAWDCAALVATSDRLERMFSGRTLPVHSYRLGAEPDPEAAVRRLAVGRETPVRFGWAGNIKDPEKRYQEIVERLRLEFPLEIAYARPKAEMPEFYRNIDVLLVTSRSEGTPLPLLEAMASGAYVIATDVGVVREVIGCGGMIVDGDFDTFSDAMRWAAENAEAVRQAGLGNIDVIRNNRSWDHSAAEFGEILERRLALTGPNRAAPGSPLVIPRPGVRPGVLARIRSGVSRAITERRIARRVGPDRRSAVLVHGFDEAALRALRRLGVRRVHLVVEPGRDWRVARCELAARVEHLFEDLEAARDWSIEAGERYSAGIILVNQKGAVLETSIAPLCRSVIRAHGFRSAQMTNEENNEVARA